MSASDTRRSRLTIEIEPELRRRIEVAAALKGSSVRAYVEEALARAVATDDPDAAGRERHTSPIHVPPMTDEERQRALKMLDDIDHHGDPRTLRHGERVPEGWELIHQARKDRTRQLLEASGMEWTEEDEAAWDIEA